ncbi:MAG: hypothetical protein NTY39_03445 [Campylobacterales bacterium]|nr:hypothetical protein [Campylobacterales bacterium]
MLNLQQLQNSLQAVQDIINQDLSPAFSDFSHNSVYFDRIITSQNNLLVAVASLSTLFESLLQEEINIDASLYLPPADLSALT